MLITALFFGKKAMEQSRLLSIKS